MFQFVVAVVVIGAALYFLPRAPLDETVKLLIKVILIVFLILWGLKLIWPLTGL